MQWNEGPKSFTVGTGGVSAYRLVKLSSGAVVLNTATATDAFIGAALSGGAAGDVVAVDLLVVCTTETGREATEDNARIRSAAIAAGIPLTTTLDGFRAAVRGLAENVDFGGTGVRTLQEYHALCLNSAPESN